MLIKILLMALTLVISFEAQGQVNCGNQPTDVPPDIQQQFQGDVEGKATIFTKLLGDVNLKGKVDSSRSEVYQKYKNLDKSVVDQYMIWVSCQAILQDKSLAPAQKIQLWIEIYKQLQVPSEEKKSRIPNDLFSVVELGKTGQTSISYLESVLGAPKTKDDSSAIFVVDGYEIVGNFLSKNNSNGPRGTLIRVEVSVRDAEVARKTPITVDGYWNPQSCSGNRPTDVCRPDINPLKLGDMKKLSAYIDDVDQCHPEKEGGSINNTDPSYFCVRNAYGSTQFIERRFKIDLRDDNASTALTLLDNLKDPDVYHLDQALVKQFESKIGLHQSDKDKKRDDLLAIISKGYAGSKVVGFAISVEDWANYNN